MWEISKKTGDIDAALSGISYEDISAALDYYFEKCNNGRPFIIAGHSQGSSMVKYVLKNYFKIHRNYLKCICGTGLVKGFRIMEIRFKKKSEIFDVSITAIGGIISVATMLYGVWHIGLHETWPELVLNLFYIACLVMVCMYFFKYRITTMQFNYWCSVCVGITILLRDILFAPPLDFFAIHILCLSLSVLLMLMLTFFYARKEWQTYSKRDLWMICIIDMVIAALYTYAIYKEPIDEYTNYYFTEIWIRPTITYGMVACFVNETKTANPLGTP